MKNSKTVVTTSGTIRVTIEQLVAPDGTISYRAKGRRFGKMVYTREFDTFHELSCFVNRSAGQSVRQQRIRSFEAGYLTCILDFAVEIEGN